MKISQNKFHILPGKWHGIAHRIRPLGGSWPDWIGLSLLTLALGTVVLSIQRAHWVNPQPSFLVVLAFAIACSFLLAKSRLPVVVSSSLGILTGLVVVFWQSTSVLSALSDANIFNRLAGSLTEFWQTLAHSAPNQGTLYFVVFLTVLVWFLGFFSTWRWVRKQSAWYAVLLGLIVLLVNLYFLTKASYGYFFFYLFAAMLLLSYTYFFRQHFSPLSAYDIPRRGTIGFAALVFLTCAILIGTTWAIPEIKANQLQSLADSKIKPAETLNNLKINLFAPIKAKGTVMKAEDQNTLYFSAEPNLSIEVQFIVKTDDLATSYWRARRYDIYNSWGWTASASTEDVIESGQNLTLATTAAARSIMTYTVTDEIKTNVALTPGDFYSALSPMIAHDFVTSGKAVENGSGRPQTDQIASVTTPHLYQPDESYTASTAVTQPTIDQLGSAGNVYPVVITNQYLNLPGSLSQQVRRTAASITRRAQTEYDKVTTVLRYLSQFTYNITGSKPATGTDEVYSFLFIQKTGNCTNFATAAVVLLRSVGVPARLATGFIPHTIDNAATYIIQARDSHAWPEVYFPGYGWVVFESTPPGAFSNQSNTTPDSSAGATPNSADNTLPPVSTTSVPPAANGTTQTHNTQPVFPLLYAFIIPFLIAAAVLAGLVIPSWLIWRRFRRPDYISGIFAKLYFISGWAGVPGNQYQTPLEFSERLNKLIPALKSDIDRLTGIFMSTRFSRRKLLNNDERIAVIHSWRILRKRILMYGLVKTIPFRQASHHPM